MAPDLTLAIYNAILGSAEITANLPAYKGSFPVFTRRPIPADDPPPFPLIIVSQNITLSEDDGIRDFRPIIVRDVAIYHSNELPANYRLTDVIAQSVRRLFHRQRNSLAPPAGWSVVDIQAEVPIALELDQDQATARIVQLNIRVAALDD